MMCVYFIQNHTYTYILYISNSIYIIVCVIFYCQESLSQSLLLSQSSLPLLVPSCLPLSALERSLPQHSLLHWHHETPSKRMEESKTGKNQSLGFSSQPGEVGKLEAQGLRDRRALGTVSALGFGGRV